MSDMVERLRDARQWLNRGYCCGQKDSDDTCAAPACIFGEALKELYEAADEIERLRKVLLTGAYMLSEIGVSSAEKCQLAYDHLSAALAGKEATSA